MNLEYFNGKDWVFAGGPYDSELIAWITLGGKDINYRTIDNDTGKILCDKSTEYYKKNKFYL